MAYGTKVESGASPTQGLEGVAPNSNTAGWVNIIDAGGLLVVDTTGLLDPETTVSSRHPIYRRGKGTNLLLRVRYSTASTVTQQLVVKVAGATGNDAWDNLPSKAGNTAGGAYVETITCTPATDMKNADGFSTSPINFTTLSWDCLGAEKFIALVSTVMAGSALTTATLQAKII